MLQAAMSTPGVLEMNMKALDMKVRRAGADGATLENGSKLTMGAMDALCDHFRPLVAFPIRPGVGAPEKKTISMRDPLPEDASQQSPAPPFIWRYYRLLAPWTDDEGTVDLGLNIF